MARIHKNPEARRQDILAAATALFAERGYAATPVEAVIERAGISKGVFYYYFESKEAVLRTLVAGLADTVVLGAAALADQPGLDAAEKLRLLLVGGDQSEAHAGEIEGLNRPENHELHLITNIELVSRMAPYLGKVIGQGVAEGRFDCAAPLETAQLLLAAGQFLLDEGFFKWTAAERQARQRALQAMAERSLGATPGSLGFLMDLGASE
jgi:AcrR family transcriptional regulator